MDIPSIVSQAPVPAYGEICVYGVADSCVRDYITRTVDKSLGFNVVFADDKCDCIALVARRLNIVNLGTDARVTLLDHDVYYAVIMFIRQLEDIENSTRGDVVIDLRKSPEDLCCKSAECVVKREVALDAPKKRNFCSRLKEEIVHLLDTEDDIESDIPATSDYILCKKQSDECSVQYDYAVAPAPCECPAPAEDEIEAEELEAQRLKDIENLRAAILAYTAKYHANPQDTIKELIKGKIVINPDGFSRVVVNGNTQIVLADYDETVINMGARERTLYIFFLKHPEGIKQADVCDYENELLQIYSLVKPGASDETASRTIGNLCDPFSDALYQSLSKIKRAVKHAIQDEEISRRYYVDGERGDLYRIAVKPELITLPAALTN